jgi:hypothetical protein
MYLLKEMYTVQVHLQRKMNYVHDANATDTAACLEGA